MAAVWFRSNRGAQARIYRQRRDMINNGKILYQDFRNNLWYFQNSKILKLLYERKCGTILLGYCNLGSDRKLVTPLIGLQM